jgi:hypothetical protein
MSWRYYTDLPMTSDWNKDAAMSTDSSERLDNLVHGADLRRCSTFERGIGTLVVASVPFVLSKLVMTSSTRRRRTR